MKHVSQILEGKYVADVNAPKVQTTGKPNLVVDVDSVINEIHMRADYIGPVLEEILHAGHERVHWDQSG